MEPIGQKVIVPNSDEVIAGSDLSDEEFGKDETRIFDATLDGALAKLHLGEVVIDEIYGKDELSEFSESEILSSNETHAVTSEKNVGLSDTSNSNIALEVMEEILLSEDMPSEKNQNLQKTENVLPEIENGAEQKFKIGENDLDSFRSTEVKDSGISSEDLKSKTEFPGEQLQTFFHYTNPIEDNAEISENEHKTFLNKNRNENILDSSTAEKLKSESVKFDSSDLKKIQSEITFSESDEIEKSFDSPITIQKIDKTKNSNDLKKLGVELQIPENHLETDLNQNEDLLINSKGIYKLAKENESFSENSEENISGELQLVSKKSSELNIADQIKFNDENLTNTKKNELPQFFEKINNIESSEVPRNYKTKENLPNMEQFKIFENQQLIAKEGVKESKIPSIDNHKISEDKKISKIERSMGANNEVESFRSLDEFDGGEKSKIFEGFQITGKESTKDLSEKTSAVTLNHLKIASLNKAEFSSNTEITKDTNYISGINSPSELSTPSSVKVGETTDSVAESLRSTELPFDIEKVVSRVRIMRGNGVEEMTLRLHPEELGQMTIKIRQSGTDLMVDMRVDNSHAKQLVESGFDSLRSRFLENEFSFQDLALNVDINERDSQFSRDRKNSEFSESILAAEEGEKQEIEQSEETQRIIPRTDSGLNLYV